MRAKRVINTGAIISQHNGGVSNVTGEESRKREGEGKGEKGGKRVVSRRRCLTVCVGV